MSKEKITSIVLVVVLIIIVIILTIIGIIALKNSKNSNEPETTTGEVIKSSSKGSNKNGGISIQEQNVPEKSASKKKMMEGYEIIGVLEIPKVGLKTNILGETTKKSLEIAVAQIYTTSALNRPGNTVIYGHNYRNTLFFSRNDELKVGDKFYITDEETQTKKEYEITDTFITTATDTTFYTRTAEDTLGKAEAILSTCTDDADKTDRRLIVKGVETE